MDFQYLPVGRMAGGYFGIAGGGSGKIESVGDRIQFFSTKIVSEE